MVCALGSTARSTRFRFGWRAVTSLSSVNSDFDDACRQERHIVRRICSLRRAPDNQAFSAWDRSQACGPSATWHSADGISQARANSKLSVSVKAARRGRTNRICCASGPDCASGAYAPHEPSLHMAGHDAGCSPAPCGGGHGERAARCASAARPCARHRAGRRHSPGDRRHRSGRAHRIRGACAATPCRRARLANPRAA